MRWGKQEIVLVSIIRCARIQSHLGDKPLAMSMRESLGWVDQGGMIVGSTVSWTGVWYGEAEYRDSPLCPDCGFSVTSSLQFLPLTSLPQRQPWAGSQIAPVRVSVLAMRKATKTLTPLSFTWGYHSWRTPLLFLPLSRRPQKHLILLLLWFLPSFSFTDKLCPTSLPVPMD